MLMGDLTNCILTNGSTNDMCGVNFNPATSGRTELSGMVRVQIPPSAIAGGNQGLLSKWNGATGQAFFFRIETDGFLYFYLSTNGTTIARQIHSRRKFTDGLPHTLGFSFSSSTGITLYADGRQLGTVTDVSGTLGAFNNNTTKIGVGNSYSAGAAVNRANGYFKDACFIPRTCTLAEHQLYHAEGAVPSDYSRWWRFNEGSGSSVADEAGVNNLSVATGCTWSTKQFFPSARSASGARNLITAERTSA